MAEEFNNALAAAFKKAGFRRLNPESYTPLEIYDALRRFCEDMGLGCEKCGLYFKPINEYCGRKDGKPPPFTEVHQDLREGAAENLNRVYFLRGINKEGDGAFFVRGISIERPTEYEVFRDPIFRISGSKLFQETRKNLKKIIKESDPL